jgi:hypothetical protein
MHVQFKISVADAFDLFDVMSNLFEHASNLAILAFDQSDFVPGIAGLTNQIHASRRGLHSSPVFRADKQTRAQFAKAVFFGLAGHFHHVSFRDVRCSLHQEIGELAVVGEQEQAFAGVIESTDGIDSRADAVK